MKFIFLTTIGLAAALVASAGQIQVGQISGGTNLGLTASYLTSGCMGGAGSCINTSSQPTLNTTGFVEANYNASLFAGATISNPQPFTGYGQTLATPTGSTMTDSTSAVTFAMISDGFLINGNGANEWDAISGSSITIPVGTFGVQQVWTMLNERWGTNAQQDTSVTFNFNTAANGSGTNTAVTIDLTNGVQTRGAVDCTGGTGTSTCNGYAQSLTASTSQSGVALTSENVFNSAYTYGAGHGKFTNTTGTLSLDDVGFDFGGTYANQYLADIIVTEKNGATNVNQTSLTAVTLVTATPEPATFLLLGGGFTLLGLGRRKFKA